MNDNDHKRNHRNHFTGTKSTNTTNNSSNSTATKDHVQDNETCSLLIKNPNIQDASGGGRGGGGVGDDAVHHKTKKRSASKVIQPKNELLLLPERREHQHKRHSPTSSSSSMFPNENFNDGNESDSSTIGSSEPESSNATVASDKENMSAAAAAAAAAAANTAAAINRSSLLMHQHQQEQHRPRTLSEPLDDYNLNVRLRAIAHSTQQFRSDYRASVDPYLLDEVTRNLFQYHPFNNQHHNSPNITPKHQHYNSPVASQTVKNYNTNCNTNTNYMSAESLQFCPPGSMCSLNTGGYGGATIGALHGALDKSSNYHWLQPSPSSWGQQQQAHLSSPQSYHRMSNYANMSPSSCCRGLGCGDHYLTTAPPYLQSPYQNAFYYGMMDNGHHSHSMHPSSGSSVNPCGSLYWESSDHLLSSSLLTNNCAQHQSYPNLAAASATNNTNQSYLSQTNLRKIVNNSTNNKTTNNNNQEYLDHQEKNTNNNNTFFPMDKSTSSQEDQNDNNQQQKHGAAGSTSSTGGSGAGNIDEYQHVNSKTEKIIQLESVVNILRNQLLNTEELFKKALMSKKTLENANCDLLSIVDKLKLDLIHLESQQKMLKEQNMKLEDEFEAMKTRLLEKDTEISSLRLTMAKIVRATGYVLSGNELALLRGKTIASDYIKNKLKENYHEFVFSPRNSNPNSNYFYSEPSSRRESSVGFGGRFSPVAPPRQTIQHQQSPPIAESSPMHTGPGVGGGNQPSPLSSTPQQSKTIQQVPLQQPMLRSSSFEDMKIDSSQNVVATDDMNKSDQIKESNGKHRKHSPFSTLPHNTKAFRTQMQRHLEEDEKRLEMENPNYHNINNFSNHPIMSQSLVDEEQYNHSGKAFSTPNSPIVNLKPAIQTVPSSSSSAHQHHSFGVSFGKRFCWIKRNRRTASAPELAQDEEILQVTGSKSIRNNVISPRINLDDSKPKGLRRIFSRKRSTSSLSGISDTFTRGGLRATSGPRLGFSQEKRFQNVNIPFSNWGTTLVADWFAMIGLGMYVNDCKRWCKNGEHLMRATSWEVEKELGIKNALHRKKLRLAVASMNDEEDDLLKCAGKLDYLWVARWLDDIGLPQYKESFIEARVDGRVLHYLTIEDLLNLKVVSQLHFASIRAAIRVLRENNYNGQCLKRRAAMEEANKIEWSSAEVSVWSSHRIMEWLRSIDLSEYAPNLRGSGVHGALILYENAFNADLFATLLSIPTNKTLLRRHISTKFKQLIGDELNKAKHEYECLPNYQPMIPGAKIRAHKKGHFTLRKKRADFELTDYVCPMTPITTTPITKYSALNKLKETAPKKEDSPVISVKTEEQPEKNREERAESSSLKSEQKSFSSGHSDHNITDNRRGSNENADPVDVDVKQIQESTLVAEISTIKEKEIPEREPSC